MNNYKIKLLAGVLVLGLTGCEKLIDIPAPVTEVSSSLVYATEKTAIAAGSGAASSTFNSLAFAINLSAIGAMAADELDFLANVNYQEIMDNTYMPLSSTSAVSNINSLWSDIYAGIYRFNSVIEGVTASPALSDSLKTQLNANARFMRALCYYYLVNLFGEVPLVLETDVTKTALLPKSSVSSVNTQIVADLVAARDVLPATYAAQPTLRTVVTKWAASALLARVYLGSQQWDLAEREASKVIDESGSLYVLTPTTSIRDVFISGGKEAILQFGPYLSATSGYTYMGMTFGAGTTQYSLRETFLATFEGNDLRRSQWIRDTVYNAVTNHQPFKYRAGNATTATSRPEAPTVLRLAEQYLIRAEARLNLSRADEALDDMNAVRTRAGLDASTEADPAQLALAIEAENSHEFFSEYAMRFFNLRRTNRSDAVLGALKSTWTPKAKYFPLPQVAINANPNLLQNPDYE